MARLLGSPRAHHSGPGSRRRPSDAHRSSARGPDHGSPEHMSNIAVRPAGSSDLLAIAAIYAQSVAASTATFDLEEPPLSWWQAKLDSTAVGDHFLVAHSLAAGDGEKVLGYAYSGA